MTKILLALALLGAAPFAHADGTVLVQCTKGIDTLTIVKTDSSDMIQARYFVDGEIVAQADNVQIYTEDNGAKDYTTDMGVSLRVKDGLGEYNGVWPKPLAYVTIPQMKCN